MIKPEEIRALVERMRAPWSFDVAMREETARHAEEVSRIKERHEQQLRHIDDPPHDIIWDGDNAWLGGEIVGAVHCYTGTSWMPIAHGRLALSVAWSARDCIGDSRETAVAYVEDAAVKYLGANR